MGGTCLSVGMRKGQGEELMICNTSIRLKQVTVYENHHHHILFPSQKANNSYSAIKI